MFLAIVFEKFIDMCLKDIVNDIIKNNDPTKLSKQIMHLDKHNLYGWGMGGCLPYGKFMWLKNINNFDVNSIE